MVGLKSPIDIQKLLSGDRRTIAKAVSFVENDSDGSEKFLSIIFKHTGNAYRIGITGPPGAGKSTFTNKLTSLLLNQHLRVGIIAVDPTSPFTGGALLGDRVRMSEVEMDDQVFIRSMASRGSFGGLSKKTREAADVLDAAGFDVILFETVGVGQSELDIAEAADTTLVILVPESGDGIQAMKAGLMEIADVFVLNKADRPGADQAAMSLKMIIGFRDHNKNSWLPDVVKTIANEGKGIEEVWLKIENHKKHLLESGQFKMRRGIQIKKRIEEIITNRFSLQFWDQQRTSLFESNLPKILSRNQSPYDIVEELMKKQ